MKRFVLGSAALLALLVASPAVGDGACRDFRRVHKQMSLSSVIAVDSSVFPSVDFADLSPTGTFAIKGVLCDSGLVPLADQTVRVVLVSREEEAGEGPLRADAISSGLVRVLDSREVVTGGSGNFLVSGLPAGEYLLQVDWEKLPSTQFVVFDLRHIPGPPLRSSVEQVGLARP